MTSLGKSYRRSLNSVLTDENDHTTVFFLMTVKVDDIVHTDVQRIIPVHTLVVVLVRRWSVHQLVGSPPDFETGLGLMEWKIAWKWVHVFFLCGWVVGWLDSWVYKMKIKLVDRQTDQIKLTTGCTQTLFLPYSRVDRQFWCNDSTYSLGEKGPKVRFEFDQVLLLPPLVVLPHPLLAIGCWLTELLPIPDTPPATFPIESVRPTDACSAKLVVDSVNGCTTLLNAPTCLRCWGRCKGARRPVGGVNGVGGPLTR